MAKKSLLQEAKSIVSGAAEKRPYTLEEEELCMAWLAGDVGLMQVHKALKNPNTAQTYVFLARCARQLFLKARK